MAFVFSWWYIVAACLVCGIAACLFFFFKMDKEDKVIIDKFLADTAAESDQVNDNESEAQ